MEGSEPPSLRAGRALARLRNISPLGSPAIGAPISPLFLFVFVGWEGKPLKSTEKKSCPYSHLSTGGPSHLSGHLPSLPLSWQLRGGPFKRKSIFQVPPHRCRVSWRKGTWQPGVSFPPESNMAGHAPFVLGHEQTLGSDGGSRHLAAICLRWTPVQKWVVDINPHPMFSFTTGSP